MSPKALARTAGALYLIIIVFGLGSELLVRGSLIVDGNAALTATRIVANGDLFRLGFFADTVMLIADIAIAAIFFLIFERVSRLLSLTAMVFRLMQAAVLAVNLLFYYAALMLVSGTTYASLGAEKATLALFFLDIHGHGYDFGLIFFGISVGLLGYLAIQAEFFPNWLGALLMAAAFVYLLGSAARFLLPDIAALFLPLYIVPVIAEVLFCLYLLIIGVRSTSDELLT